MSARLFSLFVVLLAAVAFGGHDEVPVWNEAQRTFFSMSPAERRAKFTDEDFRKGIVFKTTDKGAWRPSGPGETSRFVRLGTIPNMRDFGGLVGLGGRRFRSGVLYRSAGLNSNAPYRTVTNAQGKAEREYYGRGAERLDAAARAFAITNLGIRTDLDLRGPGECREMTVSPLGPGVKWIRTTFRSYGGLFTPDGKASFLTVKRGPPTGAISGIFYPLQTAQIPRGAKIVVYTDGITEAERVNHAQYGEGRLLEFASACGERDVRSTTQGLLSSVDCFVDGAEQSDDITIMTIGMPA